MLDSVFHQRWSNFMNILTHSKIETHEKSSYEQLIQEIRELLLDYFIRNVVDYSQLPEAFHSNKDTDLSLIQPISIFDYLKLRCYLWNHRENITTAIIQFYQTVMHNKFLVESVDSNSDILVSEALTKPSDNPAYFNHCYIFKPPKINTIENYVIYKLYSDRFEIISSFTYIEIIYFEKLRNLKCHQVLMSIYWFYTLNQIAQEINDYYFTKRV